MSLYDLNNLYKEVVMDHSSHPKFKKSIENPTHQIELLNPTCGDAILVEILLENGKIQDMAFTGSGCAISIASADMMCHALLGKTIEDAKEIIANFTHLIGGEIDETQFTLLGKADLMTNLQDAYLLEGIKEFPARYKCGILAWRATEMALNQEEVEEHANDI